MPTIKGHGASYLNAKAGKAQGPASVDYDEPGQPSGLAGDVTVEGGTP